MNNILLLDIDQTLAGGIIAAHLKSYNQKLNLGMTVKQINEADKKYKKTFDVPQIIRYRQQNPQAEQNFQAVRNKIRTSKQVHLDFSPLPQAIDGINSLLKYGFKFGGYYSVRPPTVFSTTKRWLKQHNFPNPNNVTICQDPQDKLSKILSDWQLFNGKIVLIDDGAAELFSLINTQPKFKQLKKSLILVNFGSKQKINSQVIPLPDWQSKSISLLFSKIGH